MSKYNRENILLYLYLFLRFGVKTFSITLVGFHMNKGYDQRKHKAT